MTRTATEIRKARSAEIARRDNTSNPAIRKAATANIAKLNVELARTLRVWGER